MNWRSAYHQKMTKPLGSLLIIRGPQGHEQSNYFPNTIFITRYQHYNDVVSTKGKNSIYMSNANLLGSLLCFF